MKKLLMIIALSLFSAPCYAQSINLGTFGTNTYFLQTESLRACSTTNCLYIFGQEQEYIAAKISVVAAKDRQPGNEDILSYNNTVGHVEKSALFARDGTRFVLIETATYDVNGNPQSVKPEMEETKTFVSNSYSITAGTGGASTTREAVDVKVRRVAWSRVIPGSPQEALARTLLSYAEANYAEIDAVSRTYNFIKTE